jgi:hypothetical protein
MDRAREQLKKDKGPDALNPWNTGHALAGDLIKKQDPYFPFETAVRRYAESYVNMGIE